MTMQSLLASANRENTGLQHVHLAQPIDFVAVFGGLSQGRRLSQSVSHWVIGPKRSPMTASTPEVADPRCIAEVRALRVRYWMAGLKLRFRVPSLDALAALLEPENRWSSATAEEVARPNKWRAYDNGIRAPRMALVSKVDATHSQLGSGQGSKAEFQHVLWDVLRERSPTALQAHRWMERLDADVLAVARSAPIAQASPSFMGGIPALRAIDHKRLGYLPLLDTLALTTLVMRQAHRFGRDELAETAGRRVVEMLWRLALHLDERELAESVLTFFERCVLADLEGSGLRVHIGRDVGQKLEVLREAVSAISRGRRHAGSARDIDVIVRGILRGRFGWNLMMLYAANAQT